MMRPSSVMSKAWSSRFTFCSKELCMNIREALLEVHSKAQAEKIADYVGKDSKRFHELMKLMMGPVYRITQRAAWPVSYCVERCPELVKPYFNDLVKQLEREDAHVAVRRNVA